MTSFKTLLAFGTLLCLVYSAPTLAQEEDETEDGYNVFNLEEIIVTGRKREESVQDIPVSISVLSAASLADQNVLDQGDLADLVPGLFYNQGDANINDRIAALPSIRGISSNEIATNRTKVSSFVDGMPILGSVGAINIGGATQVEVYSGPQSAAFGRSTFAGAINYVTADPGDELRGSVGVNWSDQGTRILSGNIGGPISETLGFQIGGSYEDSVSPDRSLFTFSDGIEAETRTGKNLSARFVWTPTDNVKAKLTFSHDETDDGPNATFYATQQSSLDCFNSLDTTVINTGMGPPGPYTVGELDCEFDVDRASSLQGVNDITRYYGTAAGSDFLAGLVFDAQNIDDGMGGITGATDGEFADADGNYNYTVEEAIRLISDAYSVPHADVGSQSERQRVSAQFDFSMDNDSVLQLSLMKSDEDYIRQNTNYNRATPIPVIYQLAQPAMGPGPQGQPPTEATDARYVFTGGMDVAQSDPTTIEENYIEARWASPSDERIRYVVGASYYDYEFITEVYLDGGYNAVKSGTVEDVFALTGTMIEPAIVLSEVTENVAVFGNLSYDITDNVTASFEGRYSSDKVGGILPESSEGRIERSATTKTFTPRIGLNFSPTDRTTYYFQYAVGVNPAGINADLLNPEARDSLNNGVPVDLDPTDVDTSTTDVRSVNYSVDDYLSWDEEKLTNYEIGFKGSVFDDRVSYAGAVYFMEWEDALQPVNLDWDYTYATNVEADVGQPVPGVVPVAYYTEETDDTSARVFANSGTSETLGLELQASFRINENWTISGNTSLMQAEYKDFCSEALFTGAPGDLGEYAGLEVSTTAAGDGTNSCYVLDGKKLARQPSFTLSLSPSYRTELNNGVGFNVSARYQYQSSSYADAANVGKTPSSERFNLTVGLSKDAWSGTLYVENLLDDKTATTANLIDVNRYLDNYPDGMVDGDLTFTGGATTYSHYGIDYPVGRTLGFRVNYNF